MRILHPNKCNMITEKKCSKCGITKPIKQFGFSRPKVYRSNCKSCQNLYNKKYLKDNPNKVVKFSENRKPKDKIYRQENKNKRNEYLKEWGIKNPDKKRAQKYRHRYGIDISDYDKMLEKQNHKCLICYSYDTNRKGLKHFIVDHDHKTNKVRGLLCHKCNQLLGSCNDDMDILKDAIKYLKQNS
jgi:hypothetical protein